MRSLLQLSLEALAANIKRISSLQGIPEDLAIALFDTVLRQGALTPEVTERNQHTRAAVSSVALSILRRFCIDD